MYQLKQFLFLFYLLVSLIAFSQQQEVDSQQRETKNQSVHIYSDYLEDDYGNRLEGVTVKVIGRNSTDVTNNNGQFSVNAKFGDQIVLTKDGKHISSYIYDGSNEYTMLEESTGLNKKSYSAYEIAIDSANYYLSKKPTKSILFIENALNATRSKKKNAKAYEILADAFSNLSQDDLALSNYIIAYETLKKKIDLQLKLANSYVKNGNNKDSKTLFTAILENKKAVPFQKIKAYSGLAIINEKEKKYNESITDLNKALSLARTHHIAPQITDLNSKIAEILSLKGEFSKSKAYMDSSIKSAKKENINRAIVQSNKAADYYNSNNAPREELKLRKATLKDLEKNDIKEINIAEDEVINKQKVKYQIANALKKQANYPEAIKYYKESVADANNVSDLEIEKEATKELSDAYTKIGDYNMALESYKKYTSLVDQSYQLKEKAIEKAVALGKQLTLKQSRIFGLEKDRELHLSKTNLIKSEQSLVVENDKRQKLIIYSLLGGLLLLLFSLYSMYKSNKQKRIANNLLALKGLRSQMNPHFIFNALNSVNSYISSNDERAANRYLTDFSTLMRSVLENSEEDFIPLEKEMELLKLYLKLEHSRFEDKFDYEFNISKNVNINEFQIPPMLLQPYVENAVWHGLRYKKEKGLLKIDVQQHNNETIKITITDNGIGRKKSKSLKSKNQLQQKSKGMQNIKQRVDILNEMYKDKVDVFIGDLMENELGTKVVLTLRKD